MFLKDLIKIISEADEAVTPTPDAPTEKTIDTSTVEQPKEKLKKSLRDVKSIKDASDGIGNETFDVAVKLTNYLKGVLRYTYADIDTIKAEKGLVIIKGGAVYMTPEKSDEFSNVIQQYVTAFLDTDGLKKFSIAGPFKANNDVNLVFQKSEPETEV